MMHIWLVNPPVLRERPGAIGAVVQSMFYNSPPLGLAYIAAVLERAGHRVTITDCAVEQMRVQDLPDAARRLRPELVGISSTTPYFDRAVAAIQTLRRTLGPSVPIVLGGPHLNACPEALLAHPEIDFGISGEGEMTLLEVIGRIEAGRACEDVPGVVSARDGELVRAPVRPPLTKLDDLPFPARHLLPIRRYVPLPNDQHRLPKTSAITSRGCPFACTFCAKHTFGNRYRGYSPERVVDEMHHLERDWGMRDIAFVDSTFMPTRERILGVLQAMEARPVTASWTCSCRANVLDDEILRRIREMGCWRIRIGIESGNAGILEGIRKGITKEQITYAVHAADRVGLQVKAFFMVGHIGETPATVEETIRFACSLPLKDITVQLNSPLPGTAQHRICHEHGTLLSEDPSRYNFFEPVFVPRGFSAEQLLAAQKQFYRRFYLRPSLAWRHLRQIRDLQDVMKYARAVPLLFNVMVTNRLRSGEKRTR